VTLVLADRT